MLEWRGRGCFRCHICLRKGWWLGRKEQALRGKPGKRARSGREYLRRRVFVEGLEGRVMLSGNDPLSQARASLEGRRRIAYGIGGCGRAHSARFGARLC